MAIIKNKDKILANTTGMKNLKAMGMRLSRNQVDSGQQAQVGSSKIKGFFDAYYHGKSKRPIVSRTAIKRGVYGK